MKYTKKAKGNRFGTWGVTYKGKKKAWPIKIK